MSRPSPRVLIGIFGFAWGLASESVYYQSGALPAEVLRDLAIGWTYLFGGLAIWSSRPANPTGRLMTLVGLTWFIGNLQLSAASPAHEIGTAFADVVFVSLIALILAYPAGSLETRLDRLTIAVLAVGTTVNNAVRLVPVPPDVNLDAVRLYVGLGLAICAYVVVIRRWVVAPARRRVELLPVLVAGVVLMGVLAMSLGIQAIPVAPDIQALILALRGLVPAAIPLALLVGFYRQSELRQRALVDAMPDLMIRLTRDGHYLDVRAEGSVLVAADLVLPAGGKLGDLVPAAAATAILDGAKAAIENGRTQTRDFTVEIAGVQRHFEGRITASGADEVTAILRDFSAQRAAETEQRAAQAELRQSRTRIIEAGDAERRRLERDLHDGAQQRLVSLALALRMARTKLGSGADSAAASSLEAASHELKTAIVELRELARGIHPAVLTEAGLGPAIESLVARSPVPTTVVASPERRLSPAIEATAYFVVSEALANVAKYASATTAFVSASWVASSLTVEVTDDGVGGADPGAGSGLRGLADRVAALGGTLAVTSPAGQGTRVVAVIPTAT